MDPRLREFFRNLLDNAVNSAIASVFWKMPLVWTLVAIALLIGVIVFFGLY